MLCLNGCCVGECKYFADVIPDDDTTIGDQYVVDSGSWSRNIYGAISIAGNGRIHTVAVSPTKVRQVELIQCNGPSGAIIRVYPQWPSTEHCDLPFGTSTFGEAVANWTLPIKGTGGSDVNYRASYIKCGTNYVLAVAGVDSCGSLVTTVGITPTAHGSIAIEVLSNTGTVTIAGVNGYRDGKDGIGENCFNEVVGCGNKKKYAEITLDGWLPDMAGQYVGSGDPAFFNSTFVATSTGRTCCGWGYSSGFDSPRSLSASVAYGVDGDGCYTLFSLTAASSDPSHYACSYSWSKRYTGWIDPQSVLPVVFDPVVISALDGDCLHVVDPSELPITLTATLVDLYD